MLAQKNGLSGTALKTIALVLMLLDHIHYFFAFTGAVPTLFSMLGRLSAPLFLFCTVEGFAHTRDRKRYFLRIWAIGAGMAAVQFFMMYGGMLRRGDGFYPQNGIFQSLSLLCVLWQGMDWLRARRFLPGAAAILGVLLWPFVAAGLLMAFPQISQHPAASSAAAFLITSPLPMWSGITDGGWSFLLGGVLLYLLRSRRTLQVAVWTLNSFLWEFVWVWWMLRSQPGFAPVQMLTTYYEWFGIGAAVLMLLYNDQRGSGHKQLFYWFYPTHVYLLYGLSCLVYNARF